MAYFDEHKASPHGASAFPAFHGTGAACVDTTRFIAEMERAETKTPLLVRPRGFGKTRFARTLKAYYDIAAAGTFDATFALTQVARRRTSLASRFHVLSLDFSSVTPEGGARSLVAAVKCGLRDFCRLHPLPVWEAMGRRDYANAVDLMNDFFMEFSIAFDGPIYLIIDDYDAFARGLPAQDGDAASGPASAVGAVKALFCFLKSCLTDSDDPLARLFMTGVTALSLDSLTSGFNIAGDLTTRPAFATLTGFTEAELRGLIPQVLDLSDLGVTLDELVQQLQDECGGFRFSPQSDETVLHPAMCLASLHRWKNGGDPRAALDSNVDADLSAIRAVLQRGDRSDVEAILRDAANRKPIDFSPQPALLPPGQRLRRGGLLSALFYFGCLTYAPGSDSKLSVPNRAMARRLQRLHPL